MRKILIFLILFPVFVFAQDIKIKTLRAYTDNGQETFPIIQSDEFGNKNKLIIEFDVQSNNSPQLKISFKFCDVDWKPYDNYFLSNNGYDVEPNLWLDPLNVNVNGADYHYEGEFPNQNISFPFSGKWQYFITDAFNENTIYASGKFFVVYPDIQLFTKLKKFQLEGINLNSNQLSHTFEISTSFELKADMFDTKLVGLEIIDNRRIDDPYWIDRNDNGQYLFYNWDASRGFTFVVRNIMPGNEYRNTDLRNTNYFNPPNANAQRDIVERQNFYRKRKSDLNGASIITNYRNSYSQYMNVTFTFMPDSPFNKRIFLTGAFNNWNILPEFEMQNLVGKYSITTELKRGSYDYQYVSAEGYEENILNTDWYELEGNFWDTSNEYYIFLFYHTDEKGGYDKIIGYKKISSRGN